MLVIIRCVTYELLRIIIYVRVVYLLNNTILRGLRENKIDSFEKTLNGD